jgi:hypothetical protein
MFEQLIHHLNDKLKANTVADFGEVFTYEVEEFKGDPVAVIIPSNNESDYNTTADNVRIYAFKISIFVSRVIRTKDEAESVMRDIVTAVIDDFDKDYTLSGLKCPTGYTFINVFATPSAWGYVGAESEYRVAEINLQCRVLVDTTLI